MKKMISLWMALVVALTALALPAMAEKAGDIDLSGHIVILHTNDARGCVDENLGYTCVAVAKERLEGAGATVLLLDAGNALSGRPIASLSQGEAVVKAMNAAGYDAMAAGRSDFHYGADRLMELAGMAQFPILSANSAKADGGALLEGAAIIEKGYVKAGVFALTNGTDSLSAATGLTFADPIGTAQAQIAALEAENCTLIIALANFGLDGTNGASSRELAEQTTGLDIIIDGSGLVEEGLWVNGTLIVSAGEDMDVIGCVDIDAAGLTAATHLTNEDFGEADVNAQVDQLIAEIRAGQQAQLNAAIGQSGVELNGEAEAAGTGETNLGSLAADAIRSVTGADAALLGGGSMACSIPAGGLTRGQIAEAFPSADCIVTQSMTGAQVLALLEDGVSVCPAADGRFPQVSGLTFKYDAAQPVGSRVFDVQIGGEALDTARSYLIAAPESYAPADVKSEGEFGTMEEILTEYIGFFDAAIAPEVEGRIMAGTKPAA